MASKITQEAVWQLATSLAAEGHTPTQKMIHSQLGGSMREIGPLLRAWREENLPKRPRIIIDDALTKALQAMADRHVDAMEKICDARLATMQQELDAALEEAESMQERVVDAIRDNEEATKMMIDNHNRDLKPHFAKAKATQAKYEKMLKVDEQRRGEIKSLKEQIKKLEKQLGQAQAEVVSQTSRAAAAEATSQALQAQLQSIQGNSVGAKPRKKRIKVDA